MKFFNNTWYYIVLEYESAAKRVSKLLGLKYSDIDAILDYICEVAEHRDIYYLWRPFLKDSKDDMVLEVAVECEAQFIVTHNVRDFTGRSLPRKKESQSISSLIVLWLRKYLHL